jgi:glucose-6-phosphate 1-dehydrogenase
LVQLFARQRLSNVQIIAVGREPTTVADLLLYAQDSADFDAALWKRFSACITYQQLDITTQDFSELATLVAQQQEGRGVCNRLLYCALPSTLFALATQRAVSAGLIHKRLNVGAGWHKVIYEKPFGHDVASAYSLNQELLTYLHEDQILRIDHYLAKPLISSINALRFANVFFEPLWHADGIEQIHITLAQKEGVAGRGVFYDSYGALRDVVQNHLLQLLALIAMEEPERLDGYQVSQARACLLKNVQVINSLLGQAQEYQKETGVALRSTTETYAQLHLAIDNDRWRGVPFYVMTGKYLDTQETRIDIKFRPKLNKHEHGVGANWLTLYDAMQEHMVLGLNRPISVFDKECVMIKQIISDKGAVDTADAYEILLYDILCSGSRAVVSIDEIMASWRIIDHVYATNKSFHVYQAGSKGPQQAQFFADHTEWSAHL